MVEKRERERGENKQAGEIQTNQRAVEQENSMNTKRRETLFRNELPG